MKLKRKSYGIVAAVLLLFTMVIGVQGWLPVYAEDQVKVSINGTPLQDEMYYTFESDRWNSKCEMTGSDTTPSDEAAAYIYYDDGKMKVHGAVTICANGSDTTAVMQIANGTLTLTGDGTLSILNNDNTETLITGTADAELKTENYTGDIKLKGKGGKTLIQGLKQVDLRSPATISLEGGALNGDAFISAGSVRLEANDLHLWRDYMCDPVEVEYVIEATDTENGEICLIHYGANNSFEMSDASTTNTGVDPSKALFKGTKVMLRSDYQGVSSNTLIGNMIAEGDLRIETKKGILIKAQNCLVDGNLYMDGTGTGGSGRIEIQSDNGIVSTGNTEINTTASVTIRTGGNAAAIGGDAKINADSISMSNPQNTVIAGDAMLQGQNGIALIGATGYPVIGGRTMQLNAPDDTISITRTGDAVSGQPMFGGSLQTHNPMVKYKDGTTQWLQVTATGQIYYAENCAHPIVTAYKGQCAVCEAWNIAYAELIDADGTVRKTLQGIFGGTGASNELYDVKDGDTIRFTRDMYANGTIADFSSKGVTLDLNGHTLILGKITTESDLTIAGGTYVGAIENNGTDDTKVCTLRNVKATLTGLQWKSKGGVELTGSEVTVADNAGTALCWLEKLVMDPASVLTLCDVEDGIANTAKCTLKEGFGGMTGFLPAGYRFTTMKKDPADTEDQNTILDENGQIAKNVVLRYRRLTDTGVTVTMKPTTYTYDATAKTPEVVVVHEGRTLVKDTDYTVAYADNINAGSAVITITGKGSYHDTVQVRFMIEKAAQAAPTGLGAVNVSKTGANDGAINQVSTAMEYSTDAVHWTRVCAGTSVSGLAAGSYYVRYAQTENYLASPASTVVIGVAPATSTETGSTTESSTTTEADTATEATTEEQNAQQTPAKKGTKLTTGQATVKVTNASTKDPQVSYEAPKSKKAKTITVPDTVEINGVTYKVTSIAKNAFAKQKQLKSVTIGKHVTTIGERAFAGCKKLQTITIGKSVTKIGKNAFTGCKNLKKITILTTKLTKKTVAKDAFKGVSADVKIVVPKKKLKAYKSLFRQKGLSKKIKLIGA